MVRHNRSVYLADCDIVAVNSMNTRVIECEDRVNWHREPVLCFQPVDP